MTVSVGLAPAPSPAVTPSAAAASSLLSLLETGGLRCLYQPIVELETGVVVGYEALRRGPVGSALESAPALAAAAVTDEERWRLEWVSRVTALRGAIDADLGRDLVLFHNVEPALLGESPPDWAAATVTEAVTKLRAVMEVTERALTSKPSALLGAIDWARSQGWGVALDDVGAVPQSLAMLPFVRPDVIKLDIALLHGHDRVDVARVVAAVRHHAEDTGAAVLAEGVETEEHRENALALGATYGQGWLFGRPAPLSRAPRPAHPLRFVEPAGAAPAPSETPFSAVARRRPVRMARKSTLLSMTHHLEAMAEAEPLAPVLLATFQHVDHLTPATTERYRRLAPRCGLAAAFGTAMEVEHIDGLRGVRLEADHVLAAEWDVVVVTPHTAVALVAFDLGDEGADAERRFSFVVTHDRALVLAAAETLLRLVPPVA